MDDSNFTEEEIREQLEVLGYRNVSRSRLQEFKRDLEKLVENERTKNSSSSTGVTATSETEASADSFAARLEDRPRQPLNDAANVYVPQANYSPNYHRYQYGKENLTRPTWRDRPALDHPDRVPFSTYRVGTASPSSPPGRRVDYTPDAINTSLDSTSSERRMIKRKTVRKRDGQAVYEESILDSESDDVRSVQDALDRLRIPDYSSYEPSRAISHATYKRPRSAQSEPVYRLPEDYGGPTALIRPMTAAPHTRNLKKSDPVSRYQQYKQSWTAQRAPGEKAHNTLRWSVREQMVYHDQVVEKKQHKVGPPNHFIIPSDKKRKNLRWQIRQDLAQGVIPPSAFE